MTHISVFIHALFSIFEYISISSSQPSFNNLIAPLISTTTALTMIGIPQLSPLIFLSTLLLISLPSTTASSAHALSLLKRYSTSVSSPENVVLMCFPLYSNNSRTLTLGLTPDTLIPSLVNSPFPCEQLLYLSNACLSNGTTAIDFLAEQQCLCGGSWFDAAIGCELCQIAHGVQGATHAEVSASVSSLSRAECATSPPRGPFTNLVPPLNHTTLQADVTLGPDQYPDQTAVSNYFTATASMTPGAITGEATKRLQTATDVGSVRYTGTPSSAAAPRDMHAAGGLLVAIFAAIIAL